VLVPLEAHFITLLKLLAVPFRNLDTVWGILPVYATLVLGEIYDGKMNFGRAVVNGVMMILVGADWAWHLSRASSWAYMFSEMKLPWIVTATCLAIGTFTVILGVRRKDKRLATLLGHTRFSAYFLITLYPMQSRLVPWSQDALVAVLVFALPAWLLIYAGGYLARVALK